MISSDTISQLYFSSFNDYKSGQSVTKTDPHLILRIMRIVSFQSCVPADQFEAIFLENLLRQGSKGKLSNELFDSKADDNFQQMFDEELAKSSSKLVDIGIADAIVRQMAKTRVEK